MVHRRLQRLIALVALSGAMSRIRLAKTLWPGSTEERAANSLRVALWQLSHSLPELLADIRDPITLHPDVAVDVDELTLAVDRIEGSPVRLPHVDPVRLQAAELLPDWYDDWVFPEQQRFRDLRIQILERLSEACLADGDHCRALDFVQAAAELDPLRETTHQLLMECHISAGNHVIAHRVFDSFRDTMRRELDTEPPGEMRRRLDSLRVMES
ncbi:MULTISPECIES: AfsR/SARP family transcriptional regulator [Citricoccus]|uniref:AfsR/SARP family transcriptional regulator n=1 Tax=Citricoccus TaxID=169133 RepID=UPI000255DF92|nr:bacterial transcriptional activator domain-containing protein [Citricoccus sp. CH26A]